MTVIVHAACLLFYVRRKEFARLGAAAEQGVAPATNGEQAQSAPPAAEDGAAMYETAAESALESPAAAVGIGAELPAESAEEKGSE